MSLRPISLLAALTVLAACRRDPVLIGVWEIARMDVDGVEQEDYGTFELDADGNITYILRYDWVDGSYLPRRQPLVGVIDSDGGQQSDILQVWATEGEVQEVYIQYDRYLIRDYQGSSTTLVGEGVVPFGEWSTAERDPTTFEPLVPVDVTLSLER